MKLKYYSHVAIGFVALVIAFSVYGTWYTRVGNESAKAESLAAQIQAKNVSTQKTQQSKSELEHALADEAAIKGYFINTQDIVPFLGDLQAEGSKYGAKVEVVSVSAEPAKPHAVLVLALRITGTFDAVERMLGAVEYESYDTVLSSVTLDTPGAENHAAPVWTAAATIRVGTIDTSSTVPVTATTTP
ncbi:MAG: hypothetical protein JWL75_16 [Parcubacteria group bacterium]|nr:hypothetical protein [Parcubacteria group bacterium]